MVIAFLWLALILLSVFALAFLPFYWQFKWDERLALATATDEWKAFGDEKLKAQGFKLWRAIPECTWLTAVFRFENEARETICEFHAVSRFSGYLKLGLETVDIKNAGLRSLAFLRRGEKVAESRRIRMFPSVAFELTYGDKKFTVAHTGRLFAGYGEISRDQRLIGRFKRTRVTSKKQLYALDPGIPDDVRPLLMYLAFLG